VTKLENMTTHGKTWKGPRHESRSRPYWELKADQVLNRVFEQGKVVVPEPVTAKNVDESITTVEVHDLTPAHQTPAPIAGQASASSAWGLATVASLTALVLMGGNLLVRQQQALQQERNLVLLGQLRQAQNPFTTSAASLPENRIQTGDALPPAPPGEPWMKELAKLPQTVNSTQNILKVPLHGPLVPPNLPIQARDTIQDNQTTAIPQLVGIIQVAGKSGSAIFQTGASSTSVATGEAIGSSGWRLRAISGESAIIEQSGKTRKISINKIQ